MTLSVHDLQGRLVALPLDGALRPAGMHEVQLQTEGWRAGCYFYRLEARRARATRKMLVVR